MTAENEFSNFMRGAGIETTAPIIGNGRIQRAYVVGDKRGSKNLSYQLFVDGIPNGWFEYFKTGSRQVWKADKPVAPPTHAEKAEFAAKREREKVQQLEQYQQAACVARKLATQARPIQNQCEHPYLIKKRIEPHNALILSGDLIIIFFDAQNEISTLQFIAPNGEKRFLKGGKKRGAYAFIGTPTERILIAEGWATAASLHEDTGNFCIVAGDAGNLEPVAKTIRQLWRDNNIVICGDNDPVGIKAAKAAALACNGGYLIPPDVGTDWNDYLTNESGGSE
jgi:putative DNA primase/helicase